MAVGCIVAATAIDKLRAHEIITEFSRTITHLLTVTSWLQSIP